MSDIDMVEFNSHQPQTKNQSRFIHDNIMEVLEMSTKIIDKIMDKKNDMVGPTSTLGSVNHGLAVMGLVGRNSLKSQS